VAIGSVPIVRASFEADIIAERHDAGPVERNAARYRVRR
jgi:hypothetical protein